MGVIKIINDISWAFADKVREIVIFLYGWTKAWVPFDRSTELRMVSYLSRIRIAEILGNIPRTLKGRILKMYAVSVRGY